MKMITGNTYPVRAQLKALPGGSRWDATAQGWTVQDSDEAAALAIVAAAGPSTYVPKARRPRYGSNYTRFAGGAEVYTNKRGRCEDAPCCGCCS